MLVLAGACYALKTGDLHALNRVGATLAAFSVLSGIYEYSLEHRIDSAEQSFGSTIDKPQQEVSLVLGKFSKWLKARRTDRRNAILSAGVFAAIGEILHGWGDLIQHAL